MKLRVRDVMDTNVVTVPSGTTVAEAIRTMVKENVWSLVVEVKGSPQGVVTERDILRRCLAKGLLPEKERVERIMSSPLITISADANIREAMSIMVKKEIRRLFVMENGEMRGRVTQTRLFESSLQVMLNLSNLTDQL